MAMSRPDRPVRPSSHAASLEDENTTWKMGALFAVSPANGLRALVSP